jgi:hypothetical protein
MKEVEKKSFDISERPNPSRLRAKRDPGISLDAKSGG